MFTLLVRNGASTARFPKIPSTCSKSPLRIHESGAEDNSMDAFDLDFGKQ